MGWLGIDVESVCAEISGVLFGFVASVIIRLDEICGGLCVTVREVHIRKKPVERIVGINTTRGKLRADANVHREATTNPVSLCRGDGFANDLAVINVNL